MGRKIHLLEKFLRTYTNQFSVKDMHRVCTSLGFDFTNDEILSFLESNPLVFPLAKKSYITRAGVFTGEIFSIKPTPREFEQGMVVVGSRCIPFADAEMLPHELSFYSENVKLKSKTGVFDSASAFSFYRLYGEEYIPQYLAMDPVNAELKLEDNDYAVPSRINLSGFDISLLVKKYGFTVGDRLLCCISDWDKGRINVAVVPEHKDKFDPGETGEERYRWYSCFENALLESFKRHGPCSSIEEQLTNVFLENRHLPCSFTCGSVEEYLSRYAKKVAEEPFGVETRLWYKDEEVPAVGEWNRSAMARDVEYDSLDEVQKRFFSIPPFIFDQFILNTLYARTDDLSGIVDMIFPDREVFNEGAEKELLLLLEQRRDILKKNYNWFADRIPGKVRQRAIALFAKVSFLVFKVDNTTGLDDFPQQELVILSQLYGHLLKMLQDIADEAVPEEELQNLHLSLEGMEWNYDEIYGGITAALARSELNRFKVIK